MSWQTLPARTWRFGLLLIVGLGLAFYLFLGRGAKSSVTQLVLERQQTLTRAQASSVTSFFQVFGDSLAVLAQVNGMKRQDAITVQNMDAFVAQWEDSGLVGGIVFTDSLGVVKFNSNVLGTRDLGISLTDRDYFVWAKGQSGEGEYFIGQPVVSRLGASEGQMIVPVASPVFQENVFLGVVVASVKLQPLTERFLGLLKVSGQTDVYLVNERGELLYSNSAPELVGTFFFELLPEFKKAPNTSKEGYLETKDNVLAYAPVSLDSQNWLLVMASPRQQEIDNITTPFYIRQAAVLILAYLSVFLFGIIVTRENQGQEKAE